MTCCKPKKGMKTKKDRTEREIEAYSGHMLSSSYISLRNLYNNESDIILYFVIFFSTVIWIINLLTHKGQVF